MADGDKCKHCGWQETEHEHGTNSNGEYDDLVTSNGHCSLNDCPGFEQDNGVLAMDINPIAFNRDLGTLPEIADDEFRFRRLLFINHGSCDGKQLYGDDGEMHCHECDIDFVRDSAEEIETRIGKLNLAKLINT